MERPQPEARTNDLDVGAGWRMLDVEDVGLVVSSRQGTRGPHQVPSVGEGGQARLPRHLFAHSVGAWCGPATTTRGSITYLGCAADAGAMPLHELA